MRRAIRGAPATALALLAASAALAAALEVLGLPAGQLLGPMVAAIAFAARGAALRVPAPLFTAAQAVVGLLIAPSINPAILRTAAHEPVPFLGATLATLVAGVALGWLLARARVLPGAVAIWGSMPGAATAMTLMARDAGADWRLVAVMSYLRVVCVAALASVLIAVLGGRSGGAAAAHPWFPRLDAAGLAQTAALGLLGAWGGRRVRLPAAALLGPMILGAALGAAGLVHPQLPGWLLAPAYLLIGWRIGLGFTPPVFTAAVRAAPRLLAATATLIGFSALLGVLLARATGEDMLSAYLATSPGGADSVAIIASAAPVDVPFVMAMQVLRFVAVLLVGPALARAVARRFGGGEAKAPDSKTPP